MMKKPVLAVICIFIALSVGATLAEDDPGQALSVEEQTAILEENRDLWAFDDFCDSPWYYTFVDLDHNGLLEVIAASTQGSGIFTYAHYYEVLADGSGVRNCYHEGVELEGPDDWPEIILDVLPCYYDGETDRYYYACEGVTRNGFMQQYYAWYALCLKDGVAEWERIADKAVEYGAESSEPAVTCADAEGNPISEQDYDAAVARRFAGMEPSELALQWVEAVPAEG